MKTLTLKTIMMAFALAATPAIAQEAAPVPATATAPAATAAAPAAPAAPVATFDHAKPTPDIGQPIPGSLGIQPQVTDVGKEALWMHDALLMPIITIISLFVLLLLLWVVVRYRRAANPVPSKTSHNTVIEILWTLVRC